MTRHGGQPLPGSRLREWASRICRATAMTRLIDPVIADLQAEYAEAASRKQVWRSRWIRFTGYVAFWKVIGLHATARAWPLTREWAAADDHALGRTLAFSCVATGLVTLVLMYPPLSQIVRYAKDGRQAGWLLLFLLPQAIAFTLPIGVAIGIVCGLRGRAATRRTWRSIVTISVVCCALMLVTIAWISPAGNQAFRETLAGRPQPKGSNELTLGELRTSGPRFLYHQRWAMSFATLALGPFAFGLSAWMRGRFRSIVIGVIASVVYFLLVRFFFVVAFTTPQTGWPPPFIAVWTPNIIFILVTVLLMRTRVHI
jgi:lipopolysaccharide export LptBFGC system permease protein LptF